MKDSKGFTQGVWDAIDQKQRLVALALHPPKVDQARLWRLCVGGICGLAAMLTPLAGAAQAISILF